MQFSCSPDNRACGPLSVYAAAHPGHWALEIMTVRQIIVRNAKRVFATILAGLGILVVGIFVGGGKPTGPVALPLFIFGFLTMAIAILFGNFGIRCPKCHTAIFRSNVNRGGIPMHKIETATQCPVCNLELDTEMHEVNMKAQQSPAGDAKEGAPEE